ncbi:ribonuclease H-like domain-containing protein [Patescibacteria group bacterium]|nr:ribonuclease H-like domain-containing protein [Patescibacteria group bacterium]
MNTNITVLDIETTGLTTDSKLVCFTLGHHQRFRSDVSESVLLEELSHLIKECKEDLLVTFYGAPKYGAMKGYDIPFLRNRYIANGMIDQYPFVGMQHLDVSDMAVKQLITATLEEPKIDDLTADLVVQLMHLVGCVPTKTKKTNVSMLENITDETTTATIKNFLLIELEAKTKDHNSLDAICLNVFNNWGDEEMHDAMTGADVPQIWKKYTKTGDARCRDAILWHNMQDAKKTYLLFRALEKLTSYRPITTL